MTKEELYEYWNTNEQQLPEIIAHLKLLGNNSINPLFKNRGLCEELDSRFTICVDFYSFTDWLETLPYYSSNCIWPIKAPGFNKTYGYYNFMRSNNQNMWDVNTEYGNNRRDFCLQLAKMLEEL